MIDAEDDAFKKYNRNIKTTKPDLLQYQRAKESAMGLAPGTLVAANATNQSLALAGPSSKGLTAAEDLYRGADTLAYGDHKPSEDALDRVSSKINQEYVHLSSRGFKLISSLGKKKRKAKDDSNEPVTYINERNKVFNKKVARYFDKYTKEYVSPSVARSQADLIESDPVSSEVPHCNYSMFLYIIALYRMYDYNF